MGQYIIKDNFLHFWFRFVYPYRSMIERGQTDWVLDKIEIPFIDNYVSYVYEDICREKVFDELSTSLNITRIGRWWDNKTAEIDIVGLSDECNKIIFGECKYSKKKKGMEVLNELIEKAKKVHGDKYDYSKVEYVNSKTPVCIICSEHGEFHITPSSYLMGRGCPKCGNSKKGQNKKLTKEEFILRVREIHGWKYDYSKVNYINNRTKVCIICPEHGEFWQTPDSHLNNHGCPKCGKISSSYNRTKTSEEFIEKAREIHGDKYDYSKVEYQGIYKKVSIICPEHGEFWQVAHDHLKGAECQKCANIKRKLGRLSSTEEFIEKAIEVHDNRYDYSKVNYINNRTKVCIICPEHGEFWQTPDMHLLGQGCPICGFRLSNTENEIYDYCKSLYIFTEQSNRKVIQPYELDIYIPIFNYAIEYNGLVWHSNKYKTNKKYHLNKLNLCKEKGIKLLQIFEDEYLYHKDIVLNKIKHILKKCDDLPKIYARKCEIKEIKKEIAKPFLEKYHIQGYVPSTIYLGCYCNTELIGVMQFKQERKNINNWELTRFATNYNYISLILENKYFIKNMVFH